MKVLLVAGAILVLYIVGSGIRFVWLANKGTDLAKSAVRFERHAANAPFKVLVIGDSSAVGVGASDPQHSVPGLLAGRLKDASVENHAVSGALVSGVAPQIQAASEPHYDIALVQIGGNDVTHYTQLTDAERSLSELLDQLTPRADRTIVLTSGEFSSAPIFPWPVNVLFGERNRKLRDVFSKVVAEHGASYVDIVAYEDANRIKKDASYYAADGFHPNDKGYAGWFAPLGEALTSLSL